jgi:hypothetical protein
VAHIPGAVISGYIIVKADFGKKATAEWEETTAILARFLAPAEEA